MIYLFSHRSLVTEKQNVYKTKKEQFENASITDRSDERKYTDFFCVDSLSHFLTSHQFLNFHLVDSSGELIQLVTNIEGGLFD